ncbi:MAG: Crp/Fnr family transcriptional regulator [Neofamilia sp.]
MEDNLSKGNFVSKSYENNSIIHFDGEKCHNLEIILHGKIVIDSIDEDGNLLNISDFYGDETIGGNLIFSKNPYYPMTITAKSEVKLLEINRQTLFKLLASNEKFLEAFLELISYNAMILGNRIKFYSKKSIRESLLNYLENEKQIQGSNKIILNITKKELAEKLGFQRTSLSRELAKMKKDGILEFDKDSITLL